MPSLRRILASRANGARSRGQITPLCKQRPSRSAIRHGLLSQFIVLLNESRESFDAHLAQHVQKLKPTDGVEYGIVEEMASANRPMRRAWALETRTLDNAIDAETEPTS